MKHRLPLAAIALLCVSCTAMAEALWFDFSSRGELEQAGMRLEKGTFARVAGGDEAAGDQCLQIESLGNGEVCNVSASFGRMINGVLSLRLKLEKGAWLKFYLKGNNEDIFRLSMRDGEALQRHTPDGMEPLFPEAPLESERWYHLKLYFDCSAGTYDIVLDDRHGAMGLPMLHAVGYVDLFRLYLHQRGLVKSVWLDDLSIGAREELLYRPALKVARIEAPVTVDGAGDEAIWATLPEYVGFHDMRVKSEPTPARRSGSFRLAADAQHLYLLFSVAGAADGAADTVEFFAQPDRQGPVYQWILAQEGETKHYVDGKPRDGAPVSLQARSTDGLLTMEAAIPWAAFGREAAPLPSEEWGMQLCFNDMVNKAWTTWSFMGTARYYRTPEFFPRGYFIDGSLPSEGRLRGIGPWKRESRIDLVSNGDFNPGYNEVPADGWDLAPESRCEETRQLSGNWAVVRDAAGTIASQPIGLAWPGGGEYRLKAELIGRGGGRPLVRLTYTLDDGSTGVLDALGEPRQDQAFAPAKATLRFPANTRSVDAIELVQAADNGSAGFAAISLSGARVSLNIGNQGEALRKADMQPLGEPPVTPHLPWARPLSGGPMKVLFILPGRGQDESGSYNNYAEGRIPVEIAQRIGLDYDVIKPWEGRLLSYTHEQVNRRLEAGYYDVIVCGMPISQGDYWEAILDRVREGTGLVTTSGLPSGTGDLEAIFDIRAPEQALPHPVTTDLPLALLPANYLRDVAAGQVGNGRTVSLKLHAVRGYWLYPDTRQSYEQYRERTWPYWESYYALMARAIRWAAQRDLPGRTIMGDDAVEVEVAGVTLKTEHRDSYWRLVREQELPLAAGKARVPFPTTGLAGTQFLILRACDADGGVTDWRLLHRQGGRKERLLDLQAATPRVAPGKAVRISGQAAGLSDGAYHLHARLTDHRKRLLATIEQPLALDDAGRWQVDLQPAGWLGHEAIATVELVQEGVRITTAHTYVHQRLDVTERLNDYTFNFLISVLGTSVFPPHTVPAIIDLLRDDMGVNSFLAAGGDGLNGLQIPLEGEMLTQFWGYQTKFNNRGYRGHNFTDNPKVVGNTRHPCLNDPETLATLDRAFSNFCEDMAIVNPAMLVIEDEAALVLSNPTLDLCDSAHTLAAYRVWLREKYGNVEAMNTAWSTTYASFEEPGLITYSQARERDNVAEFVVFRRFMDHVFTSASARVGDLVRARLPHCLVGYENTRLMRWYSGWDMDAMATRLNLFGTYAMDMRPHGLDSPNYLYERELVRSLAPESKQLGWFGYGASHGKSNAYLPWYWALHGASGASLYYFGHPLHSYFTADLRTTAAWASIRQEMRPLLEGVGRLLHDLPAPQAEVAIFFSQESLATAWAQSLTTNKNDSMPTNAQGAYLANMEHMRKLIEDNGYQWDFVTPRLIADGRLADYKLLFLGSAPSVDAATRDAIAAFARAGGTIIAGPNCGSVDGDGTPVDDHWLKELFGVSRQPQRFPAYSLTALADDDTVQLHGGDAIALVGAEANARFAGGLVAIASMSVGAGAAHYANFILPAYVPSDPAFAVMSAHLRDLLTGHDVLPPAKLEWPNGEAVHGIERMLYPNGDIPLLGLIQDHRFPESAGEMLLVLPTAARALDVRTGEWIGEGTRIAFTMAHGEVRLLALQSAPAPPPSTELTEVQAGELVQVELRGCSAPVSVIRADVIGPDGMARSHYATNVSMRDGRGTLRIPTALNDTPGTWILRLNERLTNLTTETTFTLRPRE